MSRLDEIAWKGHEPPEIGVENQALGDDPLAGVGDPALVADPFLAGDVTLDPVEAGLEALAAAGVGGVVMDAASAPPLATVAPATVQLLEEARQEEQAPATPLRERRWARTPPLRDLDVPERSSWADWWVDDELRQRLAALSHLTEGDTPYDRFGLSPEALHSAFPLFHALYRSYFRVQSEGHEHLPTSGPAIIAANHAGVLPFDASMLVMDIFLQSDPPRLARAIVDRWAGGLPWVNVFFARAGQVIGTRENFADLLEGGQLALVFPEGMAGAIKLVTQRYRLQRFHVGFVEQALRARAPIVPTALIGSDDQMPVLFDLAPIAKALGLPMLPITPTFPWLGPLGLLPYPVRYRIVYGEPLRLHERFGPEDADDPRLVRYLARQVRGSIQSLVDRHR
jgi:1-acyl-sn-glycerol-3-phosphate acyltransferase